MLSDLLWVNNNNPVDFRFRVSRFDIGRFDQVDGDRVAAATGWWARNREDPDEYDEENFRPISAIDLRAGLRNVMRLHLIERYDGTWSGMDDFPEVPVDHIGMFLSDDLVDLVLTRMGDDASIVCAGVLPVTWPPDDEEEDEPQTTVLLVAGDEVAVLEIDFSC